MTSGSGGAYQARSRDSVERITAAFLEEQIWRSGITRVTDPPGRFGAG